MTAASRFCLPGALVAKRFFRNRLAVVGLSILVAMFLFSFVGGLVSPYGQDEQFFTYTQMSKEFVGVTRNDTMRFVVADGQNFGSIAQSKALEAVKKGNTEFNYKDVDYTVDIQSDDFYVVYQGRDVMGYASRDLVNEADGAPKFSFDVKLAALTAMTAGEKRVRRRRRGLHARTRTARSLARWRAAGLCQPLRRLRRRFQRRRHPRLQGPPRRGHRRQRRQVQLHRRRGQRGRVRHRLRRLCQGLERQADDRDLRLRPLRQPPARRTGSAPTPTVWTC